MSMIASTLKSTSPKDDDDLRESKWYLAKALDNNDEMRYTKCKNNTTLCVIPKIIHQTWKTSDLKTLPLAFREYHLKWIRLNPNWFIKIWSDQDMLHMVQEYYPKWYPLFEQKRVGGLSAVMKADVFRYMLMETFGGVYVDMDMEPLKPVDELITVLKEKQQKQGRGDGNSNLRCLLGQEPLEHAVLLEYKSHFICNAMLASTPHHPLWTTLLEKVCICETETETECVCVSVCVCVCV